MNFQSLPTVPTAQELLEKAFGRARKRGEQLRSSRTRIDSTTRARRMTLEKMRKASQILHQDITKLIEAFPDFENLPEFYEELCKNQMDIDRVRESLGRMQGTAHQINIMLREAQSQLKECSSSAEMKSLFGKFYGRIASTVKRINAPLHLLEKVRTVMVTFPAIKDDHFTVALAGFPNVGKSTLLSKITSAKPKIANYAFTTKTLNVGYYKDGYRDVQVVDTPGTLARFEKMNEIEQMAYLTLKYVADVIVMVIDPTESYSLKEQEKLLDEIKEHDKPLLFFISKTDIVDEALGSELRAKFSACADSNELKAEIHKVMNS